MAEVEATPKGRWLIQRMQDKVHNYLMHDNFVRFFRFGALDQNILLLGLLTGLGIDKFIHRKFGVAGYGPIIGAGVSNWIADGIATIPEGKYATAGISAGTLLPLFPVCGFLLLKQSFKESRPPPLLVGVIVGSIFAIFAHGYLVPEDKNHVCDMSVTLKEKEMLETYRHSLLVDHQNAINPFSVPAKQE